MPTIYLTTTIKASLQKVFDAARSIDLHQTSMQHTNEIAIAGKTSGLIELGESVTWQAKHLFIKREMTVEITAMKLYDYFKDEMIKGDFIAMKHEHIFHATNEGTIMKDIFYFKTPYGILGTIFNKLYLTNYMKKLLEKRNAIIKAFVQTQ